MSFEAVIVVCAALLVAISALLWLRAYRRFDMWFWGSLTLFDLILLGNAIKEWAEKRIR